MTGDNRTIYNASDSPIARDRAGRMLGAGERVEVDNLDGLAGHIKAHRIIVLEDAADAAAAEAEARDAAQAAADKATAEADALTAKADDNAPAPTPTTPRTRKGAATSTPQEG